MHCWWSARGDAGEGRVFFVSVNQVLVRLWARVYSIGLTDKRVLRDFAVSGDLSGSSDY
jgi:hypothetical protein